jgi:hypothetical protein
MLQQRDSHRSNMQSSPVPQASSAAHSKIKARARSPDRAKSSNRRAGSRQALASNTHRSYHDEDTRSMYEDMEDFWKERQSRLEAVTQAQQAAHDSILSRIYASSISTHADSQTSERLPLSNSHVTSMSAASTREHSHRPKTAPKAAPPHVHTHSCAHDGEPHTKCCQCCVPEYCMCMRGVKPLALTGAEKRRPAPKNVVSSRAYKVRPETD